MKIAVLGTGMVGNTIATKLVQLGHEVKMGSRSAGNEKAQKWARDIGPKGSTGTFAEAAAFGELIFNCIQGSATLDALKQAGAENLRGKVLLDLSNPLDFSKGAPALFTAQHDSLAEQIQRAFPEAKVVKTLNSVNCALMIDPAKIANAEHTMFVSGNDAAAKGRATEVLKGWFGWKHVVDLGDLTAARGQEAFLLLWVRVYGALQTPSFNVHIVRG